MNANPPGPAPGGAAGSAMILQRVLVAVLLVLILGWVFVLVGAAALSIMWGPLCGMGVACAEAYWPRLGLALLGGIAGLVVVGVALILCWRRRGLIAWAGLGVAIAAATGMRFLPFFTA